MFVLSPGQSGYAVKLSVSLSHVQVNHVMSAMNLLQQSDGVLHPKTETQSDSLSWELLLSAVTHPVEELL